VRALVQRVSRAEVRVAGRVVGSVDAGLLVLLGVARSDEGQHADRLAGKVARLRVFDDDEGRFALSLLDTGGDALVVSQFTLLGDVRKGTRPSFSEAAASAPARTLYERFCDALAGEGVTRVERGEFGARMQVELVNEGPVTVLVEV
jgi:D-tyrosyl-tRNA(Tyr) deacylase